MAQDLLQQYRADIAYLQDREDEALSLVQEIEFECLRRGIRTYRPQDLPKNQ